MYNQSYMLSVLKSSPQRRQRQQQNEQESYRETVKEKQRRFHYLQKSNLIYFAFAADAVKAENSLQISFYSGRN
jgi:hypothetical protein